MTDKSNSSSSFPKKVFSRARKISKKIIFSESFPLNQFIWKTKTKLWPKI